MAILDLDPYSLARSQLRRDRERTRALPHLFARKLERMRGSPLALLRGSAPLFYEVLAKRRDLRRGPPGRGWIVGDAHLENFGVFRPGSFHQEEHEDRQRVPAAVFDLDDFDETVVGAFRYDVLRLTTSLLLASRDRGIDAPRAVVGARALTSAHAQRLFEPRSRMPAVPPAITQLLDRVQTRKRVDLLNARTEVVGEARRFVRGDRYLDVPPRLIKHVVEAFPRYLARLSVNDRPTEEQARVVDVAFRIAGTGSLGRLRLSILVVGKGGPDGGWVFEMKEEMEPEAAILVGKQRLAPAKRVVAGTRACLQYPPRLLGTVRVDGRSMLVRRLAPQEDKLDPAALTADTIEPIAGYCGALLGKAHRHGADKLPRGAWGREDLQSMVESAIHFAALHEAVWLAYFDLAG